jgi:hypothetical protein
MKGITEMILGSGGTNVTLTLSPPSSELAPLPRDLNSAVIPTFDVLDADADAEHVSLRLPES